VTGRLMNLKLNKIQCVITRLDEIMGNAHFCSTLTAQWPVLWRHLSAAYNFQLLDPRCDIIPKDKD